MEIQIHERNLHLSDAVEERARRKLDRLDHYLPNITDIRLELTRQPTRRGEDIVIAQLTIRHERGAILRVEERGAADELNTILNNAIDTMYRRIERFKGKRDRKGKERFSERYAATPEELETAEEIPAVDLGAEITTLDVDYEPEVVRRKEIAVIPMSERDAIEQMELLGHSFFVFFNAATGGVNVLYRRDEGDYGVLVPQTASS
jgi:putative sigma-54 modulation protein